MLAARNVTGRPSPLAGFRTIIEDHLKHGLEPKDISQILQDTYHVHPGVASPSQVSDFITHQRKNSLMRTPAVNLRNQNIVAADQSAAAGTS